DGWEPGQWVDAGSLYDPVSGRRMTIRTTQPGIQCYTGNYLDGAGTSKQGGEHTFRSGIALECQHFPDSPNRPEFPMTILDAEDNYEQHIIYHFTVDKS
ncbi:MAG: galactose-1-epimerase, partial [Rikenellaceae bacterium]|nr:galactose-1-epimerase [Rikenellaceae bacterium]